MSAREPTSREAAVHLDVADAVAPLGLVVEDVRITPAGKRRLVRVLIDDDLSALADNDDESVVPPVSLDTIADATRAVSDQMDASNVMGEQPYVLEVSSPGTDRPLTEPRHFRRNVGRLVTVERDGADPLTGRVQAVDPDALTLEDESGASQRLALAQVKKATVNLEFNRAEENN